MLAATAAASTITAAAAIIIAVRVLSIMETLTRPYSPRTTTGSTPGRTPGTTPGHTSCSAPGTTYSSTRCGILQTKHSTRGGILQTLRPPRRQLAELVADRSGKILVSKRRTTPPTGDRDIFCQDDVGVVSLSVIYEFHDFVHCAVRV